MFRNYGDRILATRGTEAQSWLDAAVTAAERRRVARLLVTSSLCLCDSVAKYVAAVRLIPNFGDDEAHYAG